MGSILAPGRGSESVEWCQRQKVQTPGVLWAANDPQILVAWPNRSKSGLLHVILNVL